VILAAAPSLSRCEQVVRRPVLAERRPQGGSSDAWIADTGDGINVHGGMAGVAAMLVHFGAVGALADAPGVVAT